RRPVRAGVGGVPPKASRRIPLVGAQRARALRADRCQCAERCGSRADLEGGQRAAGSRHRTDRRRGCGVVSADDADARDDTEPPHPRETTVLFGHGEAEQVLLEAYRSGRIPHAWLIGGPNGIGKATLPSRMARFVLANPNPAAPVVRKAKSLALPDDDRTLRRIAAQGHPDLLVLERVVNEKTGKLYTVIRVDDVRRTVPFFGSTAGEGGWRGCIVDTADELQYPQAANALLKILEEPPANALLLLISHAPARLLSTIRSRCRRLTLRPLSASDVASAAALALGRELGREADEGELREASALAEGSVGRALALLEGPAMERRMRVDDLHVARPAA